MRFTPLGRLLLVVIAMLGLLAVPACQTREEPSAAPASKTNPPSPKASTQAAYEPPNDEIPPSDLNAVMTAHFKGLGLIEQYRYHEAAVAFREIHTRAPGWIPGSINLAIALLNDSGAQAEAAKKAGGGSDVSNFEEALQLLADVLKRDPNNRHAHYCRGIILQQQGDLGEAHKHFKRVTELDPNDALSWYWTASTLIDPDDPTQPAGPRQAKEQVALYSMSLACDPYLTPAIYKVAFIYRLVGQPAKQKELLARWNELNRDRQQPVPGPGNSGDNVYGDMGKYATVIDPFPRQPNGNESAAIAPRFEPSHPLAVQLASADHWAKPEDYKGRFEILGRVRNRFGAAVATFDANGDGKLDVYLAAAVVGPKGLHDALLLNRGDGNFEDATSVFGIPMDHASTGVAAADFDADRHIDLFLTGIGKNRLLRNRDGKAFEDLSSSLKTIGPPSISLSARWLDLDQDGDLDLYIVNYCAAQHADKAFLDDKPAPPGLANSVYRNDGQPEPIAGSPAPAWAPPAVSMENVKAKKGLSFGLVPWTAMEPLQGGEVPHTGIAALDVDGDRDLDLVLSADGSPLSAVLNDRLGNFRKVVLEDVGTPEPVSGLLVTDLDQDGRPDVVAPSPRVRVLALRNTTEKTTSESTRITWDPFATNAQFWRSALAADLDLDGKPDLLGLPAAQAKPKAGNSLSPVWARNEGNKLSQGDLPVGLEASSLDGLALADLVGDPLPDLLILRDGEPPAVARNLGNGNHWLAVQLGGHWRAGKKDLMRSNSHAIGARLVIEGPGLFASYEHTTPDSGLAQSIGPVVLGLGKRATADLVHLSWPDRVMQCELNIAGDQKITLAENNRKPDSCPVLFTWNGRRFVCLGDFLGGGGLGYLVAPGVYNQPDRDEAIAIAADQLQAEQGAFRLSVTEPMDEVTYLDYLTLDSVDRPPGVSATPDERFAPSGPRPTGRLLAWRTAIEPARATDLEGRDAKETLKCWDRRTVDTFRKLDGWIGYAEEHGIILDFGDRLSKFGPDDPLVLCLAGWVEYPHSQTNYAAATAGVVLRPPTIERRLENGAWQTIEPHAGYPAGLPRLTTLDLTGKLTGKDCVLRIKTNMECYYDQAFIALRDPQAEASLRVTTLPVARAVLGYRGYTREVSPDGREPLLYDYDYIDPAPLVRMSGMLTRHGDVARLLQADDDLLCVIGPGDEARLEFDAGRLPPLPVGWTRSYVLRAFGYCKDADPFTAGSDTVEPLPWRAMPAFPFTSPVSRPNDPAYGTYLREYQTRPAGGGEASSR